MPSRFPDATRQAPRARRGERVLTPALTFFLVATAVVLVTSLQHKYQRPPLATAVVLLADGDLDGQERERMLRVVLAAAVTSSDEQVRELWAGLLAAAALEDAPNYERMRARLGGGAVPDRAPPPEQRSDLDLGDPIVRNLAAALFAERDGDLDAARAAWGRVRAQCKLSARPFCAALAEAARVRLG